jgi:hypothetical protein
LREKKKPKLGGNEKSAWKHAAALAAQAAGNEMMTDGNYDDVEGCGAKKRQRKEGPGVTARNMLEDVREKISNAVATQAARLGGKYAWMNAANAPPTTTKSKPTTANAGEAGECRWFVGSPVCLD